MPTATVRMSFGMLSRPTKETRPAKVCLVHGGTAWEPQAAALEAWQSPEVGPRSAFPFSRHREAGAELVVATPGRRLGLKIAV